MTPRPVEEDACLGTEVVRVPDEVGAAIKSPAASSDHAVVSPSGKPKRWGLFGRAHEEEYDCGFPTDPEYYERTGEPFPPFYPKFIRHFGRKKGQEMFKAMMKWRADHGVDSICERPYPDYCLMKKFAPHYTYGVTKTGSYVSWEMTGKTDMSAMAKAGFKAEDIEYHVVWSNEVVRQKYDNGAEKYFITIMDMKGFSVLRATNLMFLTLVKTYGDTMYKYYTEAMERVIVINPPTGWATMFKIISAAVPSVFGDQTIILSDLADLQKYIDPDQIPIEYGGTNPLPLEDSPIEVRIREVLEQVNAGLPVPTKVVPKPYGKK